ncbi:MAG: MFS transporter [Propionibacteriaceae bacterium]|jgi:MFS family permease|nr:MFS transporter [Propionibacteriaceae bacterium]
MPRPVWVMAVVGFLVALGFGVMSPVLPLYVRLFGVSSFLVGLVVSLFALVRLVTNPLAGRLLRRLGPRRIVILGAVLIAVTTFMMGVSDSYWTILLWRGLSGVGSACHGVGSLALIFSVTPPQLRGRANALSGGGFVVGGMAGPAVGGLVAQWSIHAPFFFYATTLAIGAAVVWVMVPRLPPAAAPAAGTRPLALWRDRRFRAVLAVNFAQSWQSYGVRNLLIPLFVVETLGRDLRAVGWAFTAAALAQFACLTPTGWATDRLGRKPTLLFGLGLTAVVGAGLAWSRSYVVLVVLLCLYSVGAAATSSSSQAMLADAVPATDGSALASYQMAGDVGLILGPMVAGALIDVWPMTLAWSVGSVFLLLAALLVAVVAPSPPAAPGDRAPVPSA